MVNTFGYISESTYMVPSTGKNKTRLRLDQLGLSLLRGLHVCFVSFEGLTHAKQRKVADWKHQTPIQPKHEATSRSSCRRCLSSASSACSTCPHLQSQAITDQWWIAPLGHRICLKNPKTMHSLAPKNWFQNDIEIQIRHVSPPSYQNKSVCASTVTSNMKMLCLCCYKMTYVRWRFNTNVLQLRRFEQKFHLLRLKPDETIGTKLLLSNWSPRKVE